MTHSRELSRTARRGNAEPQLPPGPIEAQGELRATILRAQAFIKVTREHPDWPRDQRREAARQMARGVK